MTEASTLVTGALGQLGSHCVDELAPEKVIGLDTSGPPERSASSFEDFVEHDLRQPLPQHLADRLTMSKRVIHIAGLKRDRPFRAQDARDALMANAIGTANLLCGLPDSLTHFVLVSTASVYGRADRIPISEQDPVRPHTVYGSSKIAAERLCRLWASERSVPISIVRLTQVYGPGTSSDNGIYRMLAAARAGERIVLDCRPDLIRDYLHVDDAGRMISEVSRLDGVGTLNVGSGVGVQIGDLASDISKWAGCPPPVNHRSTDGHDILLDTLRLSDLGISPRVLLADGLRTEMRRLAIL